VQAFGEYGHDVYVSMSMLVVCQQPSIMFFFWKKILNVELGIYDKLQNQRSFQYLNWKHGNHIIFAKINDVTKFYIYIVRLSMKIYEMLI
jgi:hypothetical protein